MTDIKVWFKNLIATNYFHTKVQNPSDISSPIVAAIKEKEHPIVDPKSISQPIVEALHQVRDAVDEKEGIETVTVSNLADAKADFSEVISILTDILNKEEKEVVFPEQEEIIFDVSPLVEWLKKIEKRISEYKPVELVDYTNTLKSLIEAVKENKTTMLAKASDISALGDILRDIAEKPNSPEYPFKFDRFGKLEVNVDRAGGSGSSGTVIDVSGAPINPATEEKQDTLIANLTPFAGPTTTNVTLTSADTDYLLPDSEMDGRRTIIVSNNSASDVYLGQTGVIDADATTPIGILLPAGGTLTLDCASGLYAQSDTAGVELTITEF